MGNFGRVRVIRSRRFCKRKDAEAQRYNKRELDESILYGSKLLLTDNNCQSNQSLPNKKCNLWKIA